MPSPGVLHVCISHLRYWITQVLPGDAPTKQPAILANACKLEPVLVTGCPEIASTTSEEGDACHVRVVPMTYG